MTDYRSMFSTSDLHHKFIQLRWQNMSGHLTKTSYWLRKFLMHLNWAIYYVSDLNIDPHVCFSPTLSQDRARSIPFTQPEACQQRSERPVCAGSPHKSRNGYPGWVNTFKHSSIIIKWHYMRQTLFPNCENCCISCTTHVAKNIEWAWKTIHNFLLYSLTI